MTALAPPIVHHSRGDLPVLLSVPHSGRDYPDWLIALSTGGHAALSALEDPLVDRLVWKALRHGIGAVIAQAPRAAIDCNRSEDEIDPAVIECGPVGALSERTRGGLGIVPARTQRHGRLWRRSISRQQLEQRLDSAYRPYHRALSEELGRLVDRFGCAILIDCHSMPPSAGVPPIVFGDGRGCTSACRLNDEARRIAAAEGFESGLNEPFAGGHVIVRHADPARQIYALQVEIDRRCYLDETLAQPGPGFDRLAQFMERLALGLGNALLARGFATAAE